MTNVETTVNSINKKAEIERMRHLNRMFYIMSKASVLLHEKEITPKEYNKKSRDCGFYELVHPELEQFVDNVLYYRYRLIDLYSRLKTLYNQYRIGFIKREEFPDMHEDLMEFLKYINCFDLYEEIKKKRMILKSDKADKVCICIDAGRLSYLLFKDPYERNTGTKELTIAHEMGHAFTYYTLSKKQKKAFERDMSSEIISICFEKMFFDFMKQRGVVDEDTINLMIRNKITSYYDYCRYFIKALDALDIPETDPKVEGLLLKYNRDGKRRTIHLTDESYIIGDVGASALFREYQSDRDYFIKHLPSVIKEINDMSFGELVDQYSDTSPVKSYLDDNLVLRKTKKNV